MKQSEFEKRLAGLSIECDNLMVQKNIAYGPDATKASGLNGVLVRLGDKLGRANRLAESTGDSMFPQGDESLRDTLMDIRNYGAMACMMLDGTWPTEQVEPTQNIGNLAEIMSEPRGSSIVNNFAFASGTDLSAQKMVYIASPMDAKGPIPELADARVVLNTRGMSCYSPNPAFQIPDGKLFDAGDTVQAINELVISQCHGLLALLPSDCLTVGTIDEIRYAARIGIPVVVWTPKPLLYLRSQIQIASLGEAVAKMVELCSNAKL